MPDDGSRDSIDSVLRELARAPEAAPPKDPERLGRFRITGRLGEGGMGVVYRAVDESLHRTVALKVVRPSLQGDVERRKRLVREARAAAAVTHPNIAAVYEIGESAGQVFLAMEYVEGATLRSLLAGGAMPLAKALPIALQIAEGLAKAHRAGIVHRDLKPDNVIVSVDGHAKILDFGLAKLRASSPGASTGTSALAETVTLDGQMVGTPAYASPEQTKGEDVGPTTDVFAFGVTLHEMLTGQRPSLDRGGPQPASTFEPLAAIVAKCLAEDPRERFPSGGELAAALAALPLRGGQETTSDVDTARAPLDAPRRRSQTGAWIAAAALALVALAVVSYGTRRSSAAAPTSASAPATSSATPSGWVRMTERRPPKSSSPAALAAYRMAMQDLRDGSLPKAHLAMKRALEEDPELAAAHLRECLHDYTGIRNRIVNGDMSEAEHYRRALELREALDEHDRALLRIADAIYGTDRSDPLVRAREAQARFPGDEEIELEAAVVQSQAGGPRAWDALRDLVARAAPFALAEYYLLDPRAFPRAFEDDWAAVRAAGQRCVAGTPQAAGCWQMLAMFANIEGRCEDFEALRRRHVSIDPESLKAHRFLGFGLAANGAPYEAVFEEFRALPDRQAELARARVYVDRADFSAAEPALASAQAAFEQDPDDDLGGELLVIRAQIAEETGQAQAAARMATRALGKADVRAGGHPLEMAVGILHRAGVLPSSRVLDLAAPLPGDPVPREADRLLEEASLLAVVAEQGASARVAMAAFEKATARADDAEAFAADGLRRYLRGRVRWLTGYVDDAVVDLEAASRFCFIEDTTTDVRRAALLLGEIRESQHDQPAACAAYTRVLARWGDAKPRSVTADEARARSKALGCSGH